MVCPWVVSVLWLEVKFIQRRLLNASPRHLQLLLPWVAVEPKPCPLSCPSTSLVISCMKIDTHSSVHLHLMTSRASSFSFSHNEHSHYIQKNELAWKHNIQPLSCWHIQALIKSCKFQAVTHRIWLDCPPEVGFRLSRASAIRMNWNPSLGNWSTLHLQEDRGRDEAWSYLRVISVLRHHSLGLLHRWLA